MKETGIIMSGDLPMKVLDGIKTQTRRVIKPQPIRKPIYRTVLGRSELEYWYEPDADGNVASVIKCPYGQVGDRLWVRETWATENRYNHLKPSDIPRTAKIYYLADGYDPFTMGKVRSAMFMCKWMSRARPEITEVRAERLQEISPPDIVAEGYDSFGIPAGVFWFKELWDSLNAKRGHGWDKNEWVWCISVRRLDGSR